MPSIFKLGAFALACVASASAQIIGTGTGVSGTGPSSHGPSSSTVIPPFHNTTTHAPSTTPSVQLTTSTVFTTTLETVTKCPPTVTNCPYGSVITKTIPLYTTVCPVSGHPSTPTYTVVPIPPTYYTSTIVVTEVYTITSCAPTVTLCPYGAVTSHIYTTTTVCPYSELPSGSPVYPPAETGPAPVDTTVITSTYVPVAPYPTLSFSTSAKPGNSSAPIGTGTGTGVIVPTAPYSAPPVLIITEGSPSGPVATYSPPIQASGAGRMGVSSLLALVMTGAFALLF